MLGRMMEDDGMVTSTFRTFATVQPASSVNVIMYVLSSIPCDADGVRSSEDVRLRQKDDGIYLSA